MAKMTIKKTVVRRIKSSKNQDNNNDDTIPCNICHGTGKVPRRNKKG